MWFTFGREDIGAELRAINQRLDTQAETHRRIERTQEILMALVTIEQNDLDAIAVTVVQAAKRLQDVLDSETPLSPADQSGIEEALRQLQAVGPRIPTDAPAAPVDETPATDETPAEGTPAADPQKAPEGDVAPTPDPDVAAEPVDTKTKSAFGRDFDALPD